MATQGGSGAVRAMGAMSEFAQVQAHLWVEAEVAACAPDDAVRIGHRIEQAEHALRMLRRCRHDFPRAIWAQQEIIRRLQARQRGTPG